MVRVLTTALAFGVMGTVAYPAAQSTKLQPLHKVSHAAPATTSVRIAVRDQKGAPVTGVRLLLSGAATRESTTRIAGAATISSLKPGFYRVRCEREGFVTLEREFSVRAGALNSINVVLNAVPAPPGKHTTDPPPAALPPSGSPLTTSIPGFLERNFIGREPVKESVLACNPLETVRLLQMRERVVAHIHPRVDEIIYVVAGEGAVRMMEQTTSLSAGTLIVVPKGIAHGFERRGRNPLIIVSTLTGSPCEAGKSTP